LGLEEREDNCDFFFLGPIADPPKPIINQLPMQECCLACRGAVAGVPTSRPGSIHHSAAAAELLIPQVARLGELAATFSGSLHRINEFSREVFSEEDMKFAICHKSRIKNVQKITRTLIICN